LVEPDTRYACRPRALAIDSAASHYEASLERHLDSPRPTAVRCPQPGFASLRRGDAVAAIVRRVVRPMTNADGNVQYNMQMLASHSHRTSTDSARVELRFWMHTLLEPGAIARAIISVPDTVAVRITLPDSTKLTWLVIAKRPWGQREQSAVSSITEDMFVQAPPDGLARLVSASGAALDIRGRHLHLSADQLAEWRGIVRWAWCPNERYRR